MAEALATYTMDWGTETKTIQCYTEEQKLEAEALLACWARYKEEMKEELEQIALAEEDFLAKQRKRAEEALKERREKKKAA